MPLLSRLALIFAAVFVSLTALCETAAAAPGFDGGPQPAIELSLARSMVSPASNR